MSEHMVCEDIQYGGPYSDEDLKEMLRVRLERLQRVERELGVWKMVHFEATIAKESFEDERLNLLVDIHDLETEIEDREVNGE